MLQKYAVIRLDMQVCGAPLYPGPWPKSRGPRGGGGGGGGGGAHALSVVYKLQTIH